jgi:putative flippase GtrA
MFAKLKALFVKYNQFLRFCIVGVANTAITLGLFQIFDMMHMQYLVASVIAYGAGILNGFSWSTRSVFKTKGTAVNFTKFVLVNLVAIGLNLLLMYLFVDVAGVQPKVLAQALVVPFTTVVNFTLNKFWTFSGKKGEKAE